MSKQTFTVGQVLTSAEMTQLQANDYNQTVSAKVASYVLVAADAGTRITMSNASATTVTVNTALFTAGDTLTITNIGAGVCTITAGTATVSTGGSLALNQYDSGTLYFTSTGVSIWNGANPGDITGVTAGTGLSGGGTSGTVSLAIDTAVTADLTTAQTMTNKTLTTPKISNYTTAGDIVYGTGSSVISRLGIGTVGQVLTVNSGATAPEWATPSGGTSGLNLISTTTWSATASQSFNSVFTTTYTNYRLIINVNDPTVDSTIRIRLRVSGTDNTGANYMSVMNGIASNGTPASFVSSADTSFLMSETDAGTAGNRYGYSIDLFKPQTNTLKTAQLVNTGMNNAGLVYTVFGGLLFTTAIQADGFTLYPASGNFSGTCSIYGYGK